MCTGLFAMALGIFLIILNSVISKKAEEDLETYVARQLTRSRSGNYFIVTHAVTNFSHLSLVIYFIGHRLERDVETGGLQTRHYRKTKEMEKGCAERGLDNLSQQNFSVSPNSSELVTPTTPGGKS